MTFLRNILFFKPDRDYGPNTRKYRTWHAVYLYSMLVCMGVCIGVVSLVLAAAYPGLPDMEMFLSYFRVPSILLLNLLPPVLLILLLYFAIGRAWAAFGGTSLLILGISLVNFYKISLRSDPFIASDVALMGEAGNILSNYTLQVSGRVWFTIAAMVFGLAFAIVFMRGRLRGKRVRLIGVAVCILICGLLYGTVYTSQRVYNKTDNSEHINIWSEGQVFVSKGFVYPFLHSVQSAFPSPPEGYDKSEAAEMLTAWTDADIPDGEKVNIISIMLEAYSDLSVFEGVPVHDSVYAPLHALQAESWSGNLVSDVFAGGTLNTERSFLTGYTEHEEYRYLTDSYVYYLKDQGYYTAGYHAGDGWFYNRQNVNRWLGFDQYEFLEDHPGNDRSDYSFLNQVIAMYEARDPSVPYFSYNLSYQNHGSYPTTWNSETTYLERGDLSEESFAILNHYFFGIADTSARLLALADYFRDDAEPVVLVIFGDHMPWLGNGNSVYQELGINMDTATEDGFYNYWSVPYMIWANDAAKETLGCDFVGDGGNFSPCYLMGELFDLAGWDGSAWMQAVREMRATADIVHSSGICRVDGMLVPADDPAVQAVLARHKHLEYYIKHRL